MNTTTTTTPTKDQSIAGHTVSVMKRKDDPTMRCLRVTSPTGRVYGVPVGIAMLAAGKDAWMRDVKIKCRDCGNVVRIADLETEAMCAACYDKCDPDND